ncbi:unnamed protein product, partial [Polarella glacialis]
MAAAAVKRKALDQEAEGRLHISLVGIGGHKIAEGTWHRSCKMLELFRIAHRSKPGLQVKLLHGSSKLNPQMTLDLLDQNLGGVSVTVCFSKAPKQQQTFSFGLAFAAIKDDGSVVTWGEADSGGGSSSVADKLQEGVVQVAGNDGAFAAVKDDGSVVTWGAAVYGGDSSSVADKLQEGVVQVAGNGSAFAAIKDDGSVVTWGAADSGGDSSSVADKLQEGVVQVAGNGSAFAAMKEDGSVVTWGKAVYGGDSSSVADKLQEG